jgi:hypothetical protein
MINSLHMGSRWGPGGGSFTFWETDGGGLWKRSISYYVNLGKFLDPDYVRILSLGAIWNLCEGPGLPRLGIRVWGPKGLFYGLGALGPKGIEPNYYCALRGCIENIPDLCRHLYSSCGSAKHRYMVGLPCLVNHCAKLQLAGWMWAIFIRV